MKIQGINFCMLGLLLTLSCSNESKLPVDGGATSERRAVIPESPAPLQSPGKGFAYNFDSDAAGQLPKNFHSALTGQGSEGRWVVLSVPDAPSPPNALAQTSTDDTSYRFPLAIADDGSFQNCELSVRFKPVSGKKDQAAGLVFRLKDSDNYYIVRANALENNVVLYKVEGGKRSDLPLKGEGRTYGKKASVPSEQWSILKVIVTGELFEVYLNDAKLFEVEDGTFKEAGKIALWTKADSVTYFDDLRVSAK